LWSLAIAGLPAALLNQDDFVDAIGALVAEKAHSAGKRL